VTKLTDDLEPELDKEGKVKAYTTTVTECDCPAGHRTSCRHRAMLPEFIETKRVNTAWLLDFDNQQWFFFDSDNGRLLNDQPRTTKRGTVEDGLRRRI
jgi:hypothetical protein